MVRSLRSRLEALESRRGWSLADVLTEIDANAKRRAAGLPEVWTDYSDTPLARELAELNRRAYAEH